MARKGMAILNKGVESFGKKSWQSFFDKMEKKNVGLGTSQCPFYRPGYQETGIAPWH